MHDVVDSSTGEERSRVLSHERRLPPSLFIVSVCPGSVEECMVGLSSGTVRVRGDVGGRVAGNLWVFVSSLCVLGDKCVGKGECDGPP